MPKKYLLLLALGLLLFLLFPLKVINGAPNIFVDYANCESSIEDCIYCKYTDGRKYSISYYEIEPLGIYLIEKITKKPIFIYYYHFYEANLVEEK